ncbi:MAG: methyltransferase domain-containing protein [Deltaproteobacteria bacterium]|jgi:SAM-dependent methyltransferase|nr:methyltransferase domain-containing protein [Deltaproteobacteria bacterium]
MPDGILKPSWIHLEKDHDETFLDSDLLVMDLFHGEDTGWLSQMTTLISEYAKPGDKILDPFSGLGTTLVAAGLLGFEASGIEIDASRVSLTEARLAKVPAEKWDRSNVSIKRGDARALPYEKDTFDLVLTSVPYFGADRSPDHGWTRATGQLYFSEIYEEYIGHMEVVLKELSRVLKPGGRCILVAENIRNRDGHFFPMAWDIARIMGFLFQLKDERILTYPRSLHKEKITVESDPFATNRRHEYVLVGIKTAY